MKSIFISLLAMSGVIIFAGCGGSKHASVAKSSTDTVYIPFTKDLKQRIENNHLDIKKIQFFVDQRLVLRRSLGVHKSEIKSGVILSENGQFINEVIIPKNTPGVCISSGDDKISVSFEVENNSIEFGPGGMNGNYFTLYARNWSGGMADVTYDNKTYKVSCASCYNAGDIKLVVRKSQADKMEKSQRVVGGRKVDE